MQAAATPTAEEIAGVATLANGPTAPTYNQSIAGWSRKGVTFADADVDGRLQTVDGSLPDPATTSSLVLAYVAITGTPAASPRNVFTIATPAVIGSYCNTTPSPLNINGSTGSGASNLGTTVRPWWTRFNVTASTSTTLTDQEKVSSTYAAGAGRAWLLGGANAPPMWCGYLVGFASTAAELSDAQIKTVSQLLGWTIPWS